MTEITLTAPAKKRFRLSNYPVAVLLSALWLLTCLSLVLLLPVLPLPKETAIDLMARLKPPVGFGGEWSHWLGTDDLGRDIFSRLAASLRTRLVLALGATVISAAGWISWWWRPSIPRRRCRSSSFR